MGDIRLIHDGLPVLLPMTDRSAGTHISDIIRDLCIRLGHFTVSPDGPDETRMGLGSALEHAIIARYAEHYRDRYIVPGELEKDGLFGTPDLIDADDWAVHEIKLTWASSRHAPDSEKFWRYWVQTKAYCWMAETCIGRLHVCNINGNYDYNSKEGGPKYRIWEQRFTKSELADNWLMLKRHERKMIEEGLL